MSELTGIEIDVERAKRTALAIRTPALVPVANAFASNIDDLLSLLSLPLALLASGAAEAHSVYLFVKSFVEEARLQEDGSAHRAREMVARQMQQLIRGNTESPNLHFDPAVEARRRLDLLVQNGILEAPIRALFSAGVVSSWASFECAAKDTWTIALNLCPTVLAQSALNRLSADSLAEGISGKQVAVGLLARYGFNVRTILGTLLAPKFDFTGVAGIRSAYSAIFSKRIDFESALSDPSLPHLEATRHLVVHRSGFVDEEFIRRTASASSIGERLTLTGPHVSKLANAAVVAGCTLLLQVDLWLRDNTEDVASSA